MRFLAFCEGGKKNASKICKEMCEKCARDTRFHVIEADVYKRQAQGWPEDDATLKALLQTFVLAECEAQRNWNMENFIEDQVAQIRQQVGDQKVLLAYAMKCDVRLWRRSGTV